LFDGETSNSANINHARILSWHQPVLSHDDKETAVDFGVI